MNYEQDDHNTQFAVRSTQYAIRNTRYAIRNTQYAGVLSFTAECYNFTFLREEQDLMLSSRLCLAESHSKGFAG